MISKFSYDTDRYNFRKLFCELIKVSNLETLHEHGGFENMGDKPGSDNNSEWHNEFYRKMKGSYFMDCYTRFILKEIMPQLSEPIVYQKFPTLRIQIPNGKGVAAYHVDSEYNHPVNELNIWLPFTHAKDSRSIYIESESGNKDYQPQDVNYGEYIVFEGGKLSHGNEINTTKETRVSIDMRVIPLSEFTPSDQKGIAFGKVRTTEGKDAYYDILK